MYNIRLVYFTLFAFILFSCSIEDPVILKASFTIETSEAYFGYVGEINKPIIFKNSSTGASEFRWLFGDGSESTDKYPMHTYSAAGSYQVQLTVTDGNESNISSVNLKIGKRHLRELLIEEMSFTNQFGDTWDFGSGPDVIIVVAETGNPDNSLILSTVDNISILDLPYGGKITFGEPIFFISEKWSITLIENNIPMDIIDNNDNFMFSSTFNPILDGVWNLEKEKGKILIVSGQDDSGNITTNYKIKLDWKLDYH